MGKIKEKQFKILLLISVALGLIFRIINANNLGMPADPAHFVVNAVNFLDSGLLVTWDQSTFLWHAVTDIFYGLFGITQFASRFSSVLFGTMTIFVIYLFVKEFSGNRKMALISAMLYAFIPTFIVHSADEHDVSVLFFMVLSFYYLIKGLKRHSNKALIISGVVFGIACMWKAYVPILIVPWLGMIVYYWKTNRFDLKKNLKIIIIVGAIILLLVSPVLVYNYSNVKHNGVPTFFFVKFFSSLKTDKVNDVYGWVSYGELNKDSTFLQRVFISHMYGTPEQETFPSELEFGLTKSVYSHGRVLWFVVIFGLFYMFIRRKKDTFAKDYIVFYLLYFIIPFLVLVDGNMLVKHYFHFLAFALPIIAYLVDRGYVYAKIKNKTFRDLSEKKNFLYWVFGIFVLIVYFVVLSLSFNSILIFSGNHEGKFIKYKQANIPENAVVLYDDRIYNSLGMWLLNDRIFMPISSFGQYLQFNEQSTNRQVTQVFILECVKDDCGWGTVKNNPQLNQSMEEFITSVSDQGVPVVFSVDQKLVGEKYYNPLISGVKTSGEIMRVYKTQLELDIGIAKQVKGQLSSFMYPVGYENKELPVFKDNFVYYPDGFIETLLNKIAWFFFYLEIFLSFIAIPWVLIEWYIYF